MSNPIEFFNIMPSSGNDYFPPIPTPLYFDTYIFESKQDLNEWASQHCKNIDDHEDDDNNYICFFAEVYTLDRPALFGVALFCREALKTSNIVNISSLAATRFLDKISLNGWTSFDREVIAKTTATISRQIVDEIYSRELLIEGRAGD
jgi:hypothetical protein